MPMNIDDYINSFDVDKVPIPDWNYLGVKSVGTIKIPWDSIVVDDIEHNKSKVENHESLEIQNLKFSFAQGVDTSQFPPAVVKQDGHVPYKLVYGFGRSEALRDLGKKEWFFTLLEGTEDGIEDVQAAENEGLPKRLNKEVDMRKFLIGKIKSGKIAKDEQSIRKKFNKVYPNRTKDVATRVITSVLEQLEIHQPYIIYTSVSKQQDWMKNHSSVEYAIGGNYDASRDMYGVIMKEGYGFKPVYYALKRFVETGKKTYILYHCPAPSKSSLDEMRRNVVRTIEESKQIFMKLGVPEESWPIVIGGALPQDRETENLKTLCGYGEFVK